MIKIPRIIIMSVLFSMFLTVPAHAKVGDMGFFGGTSEGRKLPKTTEIILADTKKKTTTDTFVYKELIVVGGEPVVFEGILTIKEGTLDDEKDTSGTYTTTYTVEAPATGDSDIEVDRKIVFTVNWRKEGQQIIKDYEVKTWSETIIAPGGEFEIDEAKSHFSVSVIEDHTPGVTYAKGNVSMTAVYGGESEGATTTVQTSGSIYSYDSVWSNTETQRLDTWVYGDGWEMQYQIRPSVSVNKTLQYTQNEPTAISFSGNYMEVISNQSSVSYDIFVKPNRFYAIDNSGTFNVTSYNSFEQLIAPDTTFLRGHFAEDDIKKLFSMQVLTGEPSYFQPDQAMTRGQYVQALAKAVKLPVKEVSTKKSSKKANVEIVFPDVMPNREEYPYIMAAFDAGLAIGRDTGNFYIDASISREEAIVMLIRVLGLENLGVSPTSITSFTDDAQISSWAKKEVSAALTLGIISGDADGKFRPHDEISKAEGAAFVNRLITYMRQDLVTDYRDNIVNYSN